jgi:hypothetical protein
MTHDYLYCLRDTWEERLAGRVSEFHGGYHAVAEHIAETEDCDSGEYPDERTVWVKDITHDVPRKFTVYAETVRQYDAREDV